jgi:DnaJ domain
MPVRNGLNHYQILEVPRNAKPNAIRDSYSRLVIEETHRQPAFEKSKKQLVMVSPEPDGNEEAFKLLQNAYDCLKDPKKRKAYDNELKFENIYATNFKGKTKASKNDPDLKDTVAYWRNSLNFYKSPTPNDVNPKTWKKFPDQKLNLAMQPLKKISKDLINTFKPYKSSWYQKNDAMQFLYGLEFLSGAIACLFVLACWPLMSLAGHIIILMANDERTRAGLVRHIISIQFAGELILGAFTYLVGGILQLATAPLNFLIRMPLRWLLTPKNTDGLSPSNTLNRLVNEFDEALKKPHSIGLYVTYTVIQEKLQRAENKNRHLVRMSPEYIISTSDVDHLFHDYNNNCVTVKGPLNNEQKTTFSKYLKDLKQSLPTSEENNSPSGVLPNVLN